MAQPDFRDVGLRSGGSELAGLRYQEASEHAGERVERKFVDAVADVLDRRMETDPGVVVLGEDVHRLKGGTNGATRGLKDKYPDACWAPRSPRTPSPAWAAAWPDGRYRPIVEFMYPDFMGAAADQVFNQIGRPATCSAATSTCPSCCAPRSRWARAMARSTRWTRGRHLRHRAWLAHRGPVHALRLRRPDEHRAGVQDPVLVIEHVDLYGSSGEVPAGDLDYAIPFGKAQVRRQGARSPS